MPTIIYSDNVALLDIDMVCSAITAVTNLKNAIYMMANVKLKTIYCHHEHVILSVHPEFVTLSKTFVLIFKSNAEI